jgi:hypothetical protein
MLEAQQSQSVPTKRAWNWRIWTGFLLAIAAPISYFVFFYKYPITRNVPWANWLLFALAGWLLYHGWRRARRSPESYRGKIAAPILSALSLALALLFGFATLYATRMIPVSSGAPKVGSNAPDFSLSDATGKTLTLSALLSEPFPGATAANAKPRAVALIFYRGYW